MWLVAVSFCSPCFVYRVVVTHEQDGRTYLEVGAIITDHALQGSWGGEAFHCQRKIAAPRPPLTRPSDNQGDDKDLPVQ